MNRIFNIGFSPFIATLIMIAIKGVPLNETISNLHDKTRSIGTDETMTSLKDLNSENLEPSDTLKNATEAR